MKQKPYFNDNWYDKKFYDSMQKGSLTSAQEVVPLILQIINANSVVDIGCGLGFWLSVFKEQGVEHILGLDGDYIDHSNLLIPESCFKPVDLSKSFTLERTFDLAISLEVAEHISFKKSPDFIESLCLTAPVILFSAAIPGQGGVHHINEQWPSFWRSLFAQQGFLMFDPIRHLIWHNPLVEMWYKQNIFLFAHKDYVSKNPVFEQLPQVTTDYGMMLVSDYIAAPSFTLAMKRIPDIARRTILRRLNKL